MKRIILFILFVPNLVVGQSFVPNAPELNLKSYMLIEPKTNTVIAESNASGLIEPASMTKVMTAYVVADQIKNCLLYTSDAADDTPCVDLGGRRIIKKKKQPTTP